MRRTVVIHSGPDAASRTLSWRGKAPLLLLTIGLFTLSFAPFKQFYLAWFALVPWLVMLRHCRTTRAAFGWSWLGGVGFFVANMWWLAYVTGPGMLALMAVLGLYWAAAGAIIHGLAVLRPDRVSPNHESSRARAEAIRPARALSGIIVIAVVWVGLEWVRGVWPLGGLPWLYLGHTQSPVLHLCQIADLFGVYGISFWVALINAWVALLLLNRRDFSGLVIPGGIIAAVLLCTLWYGIFRFSQKTTSPGPTVMVVQPNYPQSNSGEKGADLEDILIFHIRKTRQALHRHPNTDLVIWSETMMPPLNSSAIEHLREPSGLTLPEAAQAEVRGLALQFHTSLLVGGMYWDGWVRGKDGWEKTDRRNSAYFFSAGTSALSSRSHELPRYDKVHLVPFGEYLPFKSTIPPLYRLFLKLSPYTEAYTLTAGPADKLTAFSLKPNRRFVTPICFEDIDPRLVRRMFAPTTAAPTTKRAGFIVNITNDGWFKYNEMPQHLQAAIFRSIENRAPTARSVNTGISGFIDSMGRTSGLIPAGTEGVGVATLSLDGRTTFYTRHGDVFAVVCALLTALLGGVGLFRWWRQRRIQRRPNIARGVDL